MHRAGEKLIPVGKSDDKCLITAMLAASITGKYLAPQLHVIYVQRKDPTLPSSSDLPRRMRHLAFRQSLVQ